MPGRVRPVAPIADRQVFALDSLLDQAHHRAHGDAARHFAGLVAAHAVGQHDEPDVGVGAEGVLVVLADTTRIGHCPRNAACPSGASLSP